MAVKTVQTTIEFTKQFADDYPDTFGSALFNFLAEHRLEEIQIWARDFDKFTLKALKSVDVEPEVGPSVDRLAERERPRRRKHAAPEGL